MNTQLKTQITKLRVMAQLVIAECDKTESLMDAPVSNRVINKAKGIALARAEFYSRRGKKGRSKQS